MIGGGFALLYCVVWLLAVDGGIAVNGAKTHKLNTKASAKAGVNARMRTGLRSAEQAAAQL